MRRRISLGVIQIRSPGKIRCGFSMSPLSFQIDGHTHGVARYMLEISQSVSPGTTTWMRPWWPCES